MEICCFKAKAVKEAKWKVRIVNVTPYFTTFLPCFCFCLLKSFQKQKVVFYKRLIILSFNKPKLIME